MDIVPSDGFFVSSMDIVPPVVFFVSSKGATQLYASRVRRRAQTPRSATENVINTDPGMARADIRKQMLIKSIQPGACKPSIAAPRFKTFHYCLKLFRERAE
jgi:hypothetical protein